jgi:tripartite-type tricarboxylate transporter receptor subunit TctC
MTTRRRILSLAASSAAVAAAWPLAGQAQSGFPNKPVRMIVPYPPGGSVDPVARMVSEKLSALWGQQVIVDNRPGASTIIGTDAVAKAPADGYTLLFTASTHVSNPLLFNNLPYDSVKDFAPVSPFYLAEFVLVAHPSVKGNTLQELIAEVRANPNKLSYGSAGNGNANHMGMELFSMMTNTKMLHVPYKGGGPLLTDLLAGQIQLFLAVPVAVIPHLQSGKLKGLVVSSAARSPHLAQVPTVNETGLTRFEGESWFGIFAPAGTPPAVVAKLREAMAQINREPEFIARVERDGGRLLNIAPGQQQAFLQEEIERWVGSVQKYNVTAD